jgi:hypothetical protein
VTALDGPELTAFIGIIADKREFRREHAWAFGCSQSAQLSPRADGLPGSLPQIVRVIEQL